MAKTIEQSFEKLEDIINTMEKGKISLEETFKLYSEGIKIVEGCKKELDKVEKKILIVKSNGETIDTNELGDGNEL